GGHVKELREGGAGEVRVAPDAVVGDLVLVGDENGRADDGEEEGRVNQCLIIGQAEFRANDGDGDDGGDDHADRRGKDGEVQPEQAEGETTTGHGGVGDIFVFVVEMEFVLGLDVRELGEGEDTRE